MRSPGTRGSAAAWPLPGPLFDLGFGCVVPRAASLLHRMAISDDLTWPPPPASGEPLVLVDFRFTVAHVSHVDTRDLTARIKFGVILHWTDPRMVDFYGACLPETLWGPDLHLRNTTGAVDKYYENFSFLDVAEGRLKRIINFEATITVPMELSNFPFDFQAIRAELVSISHWSQCAGPRHGSVAKGQTYALRPVTRVDEDNLMRMMWNGHISEWFLHSWTIEKSTSKHVAGFTMTLVLVELHVHRKYRFYYAKVLLPLVLLTSGAFMVQLVPTPQLAERLGLVFTMFLAAFAVQYFPPLSLAADQLAPIDVPLPTPGVVPLHSHLSWSYEKPLNPGLILTCRYVISDFLPRLDFFTSIDWAINLTMLVLLWLGTESYIVYQVGLIAPLQP